MLRAPNLVLSILVGLAALVVIWVERTCPADRAAPGPPAIKGEPGAAARQAASAPRQPGPPSSRATTDSEVAPGDGSTTCPPGYPVKGKASSKIYHVPGQRFYDVTIATQCFATAEAAEAAGYRASKR